MSTEVEQVERKHLSNLTQAQRCILYRNQPFDLLYESSDWFLYDMQYRA